MSPIPNKSNIPHWALAAIGLTLLTPAVCGFAQEQPPSAPTAAALAANPLAGLPRRELTPTFQQLGQGSAMML